MNNNIDFSMTNISLQEINKFKIYADSWWDLQGQCKILHNINPIRLEYILDRSNGLFEKNVLDIGCGGGILTESMANEGAKVTGLDISIELLTVARLHALNNNININYYQETAENHSILHSNSYDIITCMEVLEHVPNPLSLIHASANLVKQGGEVFFSTINRNLKSWMIAIIGAEYLFRIIPVGTHNIKNFIRPAELLAWIDNTLLYEQDIVGIHYNIWKNQAYINNNINVNYILHARKLK